MEDKLEKLKVDIERAILEHYGKPANKETRVLVLHDVCIVLNKFIDDMYKYTRSVPEKVEE